MIKGFSGKNEYLSNFFPCVMEFEGIVYKTSEHAYQAAKTLDRDEKVMVALKKTPGQAKRAGYAVTLRPGWEDIKLSIMEEVVRQKFLQHPELLAKLLATGDEHLEEGNTWGDVFWGTVKGIGENHLGRILMRIRDELRNGNLRKEADTC